MSPPSVVASVVFQDSNDRSLHESSGRPSLPFTAQPPPSFANVGHAPAASSPHLSQGVSVPLDVLGGASATRSQTPGRASPVAGAAAQVQAGQDGQAAHAAGTEAEDQSGGAALASASPVVSTPHPQPYSLSSSHPVASPQEGGGSGTTPADATASGLSVAENGSHGMRGSTEARAARFPPSPLFPNGGDGWWPASGNDGRPQAAGGQPQPRGLPERGFNFVSSDGSSVHGRLDQEEIPFWHLIGYRTNPNSPNPSEGQDEEEAGRPLGECTICMEELQPGQVLATLPCWHHYHHKCVADWFTQKIRSHQDGCCPNCNMIIVKPTLPPPGRSGRSALYPEEELVPLFPLPFFREIMIEPSRRAFLLRVFFCVFLALVLNCVFVWALQ